MFPEITLLGSNIKIYTYGVMLSISVVLFLWMTRKMSRALDTRPAFFFNNTLWFLAGTFLGSRILHIIGYWSIPGKASYSLEHPILSFFTMSDFYFSFAGAVIGFVAVYIWKIQESEPEEKKKFMDIFVTSFLFAAFFGYIGAFLGGQIYGVLSRSLFSVDYSLTNPYLGEFPRFPLAIVYALLCGVIFSFCYIFRKAHSQNGVTAHIGIILFSLMLLLGEFWNPASRDHLAGLFGLAGQWRFLNFNQIISLIGLYWGIQKLIIDLDLPVGKYGHFIFQTKRKKKKPRKKKAKKK